MIDFKTEITKFSPALEVEDIGGSVGDGTDITELLKKITELISIRTNN